MLLHAGRWYDVRPAKWLRQLGAVWPSTFIGSIMFQHVPCVKICWTVPAIKWALANGCAWGEWQCQKLNPDLYTLQGNKRSATEVFAWAHKNGCPCTCDRSSSESN
jgi:hypothetical protein